ncbi:hypothetical protein GCM10007385_35930 [Tateyamaria omphalii]|uniref:glycosyltransferase n=1 Tax=Tateyamaria omphalii TaxID=299262 RepID=UPI0016763E7C|nr:glycosyltransferase [Tateyamaria omphalii]GGX63588.1 hypothetical protein GCM10007385_35930 [Tateyamaria omphalii]
MDESTAPDRTALIAGARAARLNGRPGEAWRLLELARSESNPSNLPAILMIEAELLHDAGRVEAAEDRLHKLLDQVPDHFWAAFHLAAGAWRRKEFDLAQTRIATARALDPDGRIGALWRLRVNLMKDLGHSKRADHLLRQMAHLFENDPWPRQQMAIRARAAGQYDVAVRHCRAAMRLAPDDRSHALLHAQVLAQQGEVKQAAGAYAEMETRFGANPELALARIQLLRSAQDFVREIEALSDALSAHPDAAALWQHLFSVHLAAAPDDVPEAVLELLNARIAPPANTLLSIRYCLETDQFDKAKALCRTLGPRTSHPMRALERAQALWGMRNYRMALRYLRFCIRRWPASPMLLKAFIVWGLKLGQGDAVAQAIELHLSLHSEAALYENRLLLAGFANDLPAAIASYKKVRAGGQVKLHQQELMAKMIATLAEFDDIPSILADTGDPLGEAGKLLHRAGVPGVLMLEYEIERSNGDMSHADLNAWARARPDSTLAAIRVIDRWRRDRAQDMVSVPAHEVNAKIPAQIYQYWHDPNPPEMVASLVASWSGVPRYAHMLMDQKAAVKFLRKEYGAAWLRAFQLATNPSEQADLLRLCILARNGGIYADVDDCLFGDLDSILANGAELILYRETMAGAIGNNFIAARPQHPVVLRAAELARDALLERSVELSWSKTGPGLLTRVLSNYVLENADEGGQGAVHVLAPGEIERSVSMHNRLVHKSAQTHWSKSSGRGAQGAALWVRALCVLERSA